MSQVKNKKDAYSKRASTSIAAPMELDSDSDFNPGAYVPEVKPKKKGRGSAAASLRTKRKQSSLSSSDGDDFASFKRSKYQTKPEKRPRQGPNILLEYFEKDLNLHSESDNDADEEDPEDAEDEDSDAREERNAKPFVTKTMDIYKTFAKKPSSAESSIPVIRQGPSAAPLESATSNKPNPPPPNPDDSVTQSETESDTDDEIQLAQFYAVKQTAKPPSPPKPAEEEEDSVTESDTEPELDEDEKAELHPKPGFPLRPGQHEEGPMVLDAKLGIKVPGTINTYLRDYQREGVEFLYRQYKKNYGGLLGDDMGLVSKTIQVISFLSAIMRKTGLASDEERRKKRVCRLQDSNEWKEKRKLPPANELWPTCLIIAPSSVVHNWKREFETWGYFEVGVYTGKEKAEVLHDFKLGRLDVVLATFEGARADIDLLDELAWSCIIIDEVHRVKSPSSKSTLAYHQFSCQRRFGLTGTTIQNSYKEMWTILDWTNPGMVGTPRQWQGYIVKPLTMGQSAGASEEERALALIVAETLRDKILPHFFLRRTKDIIKDQLPNKTDQVIFCPLSDRQIYAYKNILNTPQLQNLIHSNDPCECGSTKKTKDCCHPFVPGEVFRFMSILIKLSNHLGLILPGPKDTIEQTANNRRLASFAFPDGNVPKFGATMMSPKNCGKWTTLEVLLKEWRKDKTNKVLIFTKSVKLLEMLEFHLNTRSYTFVKLDGSTKQEDRMPMIDKFNLDPDVYIFLISTLAGGTGLNLTGANKVVIFDPNWNPAHDLQAMDRAFRFGQLRDVSVYRLLGAGSVEELIYARQIYKQQQMAIGYNASVQTRYFEGIQGDITKQGELFGIKNIFKLNEDKLATKMAIEKANLAELDWALANMPSGARAKKNTKNELVTADAHGTKGKDSDGMDLKGLGALLFDDEPPRTQEGDIQKTLSAIGVRYTHNNDDILVPSKIEAARTKIIVEKRKKVRVPAKPAKEKVSKGRRGKKAAEVPAVDVKPWPPLRGIYKLKAAAAAAAAANGGSSIPASTPTVEKAEPKPAAEMTPEEQLAARKRGLIHLGFIKGPGDVPNFAREFARETEVAREAILTILDKWAEENPVSSDSDSGSDSDSDESE